MAETPASTPLVAAFEPLCRAARGVDLADPAAAERELARRFGPSTDAARALEAELVRLLAEGKVANRGELPVRYGRVAKAGPETLDFSIDVVHMNGAGPRHRHPEGEVNYCIALDGRPTFEGKPPGWVVLPRESTHVPTVAGGTMLIVYLLPQGKIEFLQ
ncbi:MAG: DUF4863 family protein [Planctomycetes bacterium]|nr:DUF4863 family protein [Planctomycetota bacterium]